MSSPDTEKLLFRQLLLNSSSDAIQEVESIVDEIRSELDVKEDVYANMMVAITEAVNNGIYHGNQGDPEKQVTVDFEMKTQFRLMVRVTDQGPGFDPDALSDPTAPENLENLGGRGVFLMQHLSDEIHFLDEGRQVEMWFNI